MSASLDVSPNTARASPFAERCPRPDRDQPDDTDAPEPGSSRRLAWRRSRGQSKSLSGPIQEEDARQDLPGCRYYLVKFTFDSGCMVVGPPAACAISGRLWGLLNRHCLCTDVPTPDRSDVQQVYELLCRVKRVGNVEALATMPRTANRKLRVVRMDPPPSRSPMALF